ncbi:hypothetical protein [Cohnella caldifontis]|uniref:hypothetical protein n=1 Tax=Cohnella caldifontis TaxID=3027471 RepID=UPI0023EB9782|nr:hypothetical protein [Cohnella sp. YIM B05605]
MEISFKEKAVSFLQMAASGKVREAYRYYIGDGLIVELWDLGQSIPESSVNENGMF